MRNYPAAARLIEAGADPADVVRAMSAAAYEATFNTLFVLTGEEDIGELAESDAVQGLHEDLLSADPTGHEALARAEVLRQKLRRLRRHGVLPPAIAAEIAALGMLPDPAVQ